MSGLIDDCIWCRISQFFCVNGNLKKAGLKIFIDNAFAVENLSIYGDPDLSRDIVYVRMWLMIITWQ